MFSGQSQEPTWVYTKRRSAMEDEKGGGGTTRCVFHYITPLSSSSHSPLFASYCRPKDMSEMNRHLEKEERRRRGVNRACGTDERRASCGTNHQRFGLDRAWGQEEEECQEKESRSVQVSVLHMLTSFFTLLCYIYSGNHIPPPTLMRTTPRKEEEGEMSRTEG